MRNYALIVTASALLLAASCQIEPVVPETPDSGTVVLRAGFDDDTRTVINGTSGSVSWSPGEKIIVFPSKYNKQIKEGQVFTSTNTCVEAVAEFKGVLPTAKFDFEDYWALYPVNSEAFANSEQICTTLPGVQTGIPDSFPDNLNVAAAYTKDPYHLSFQHPLSGLRFSVQSGGITKVSFRSNENYEINGNFSLISQNGIISTTGYGQLLDDRDNVEKTIIELTPASGTFEPGRSYYIILLPLPMTGGFTLLFERNDGKCAYKYVNQDVNFPRATFRTLMDADAGLEWKDSGPQLSEETVNLGEEASYFTVEVRCPSVDYTVSSDCDWMREVAAEDDVISYNDAYNLNLGGYAPFQGYMHCFLAKANTGATRTGHIVFKQGGKSYRVTVNQAAGSLPSITRHHLGFTMRAIDNMNDWWKRDLLWEAAKASPEGALNIAEGFYGQNGSNTFLTGKWLTWQYRNWGAIDGRVTLEGWNERPSVEDIKGWMKESDDYYPPLTSIAVTASSVDTETRLVSATVKVYAAKAGKYKLTGVLIEDSASYGNGGQSTKNSNNLIVAMLTDYSGTTLNISSDGGSETLELSVTAPETVHSAYTGNWGDLEEMRILLYTQAQYDIQAKVNATAPLNSSLYYIDNSRIVDPGSTCEFEISQ